MGGRGGTNNGLAVPPERARPSLAPLLCVPLPCMLAGLRCTRPPNPPPTPSPAPVMLPLGSPGGAGACPRKAGAHHASHHPRL